MSAGGGGGGVGEARLLEEERVRRLFRIHELMRYAGVLILINPLNSKCTNLKIREKKTKFNFVKY